MLGLYVQDEFALSPDLTLHAGLRWGKQSGSASAVHPRLGLVYWWNPATAVKLLHGTAYRPPNAYERDYRVDLPGGVVEGAGLRSERVRTTELALEHAPTGASRVLLTAFRSSVTNLIAFDTASHTDRLTVDNTRSVQVHGLEAEAEQRWQGGQRLRVAYGWQRARDPSQAGPLTNVPRHLLKLQWSDTLHQATGPLVGAGRYAIEAIGIGPRSTVRGTRLPGHVLANATYTTRVANVDVSVGVYNLFNRWHADPVSLDIREDAVRQDGRTYRIKLTYAF